MRYRSIPPALFMTNRQKLMAKLPVNAAAIVHANDEMHRSGDQNFPFWQNANLFYLTGVPQEKTILLLLPGHPDEAMREVLFIRQSNPDQEVWQGHKLTPREASDISGIKIVRFEDELIQVLKEHSNGYTSIFFDIPESLKYTPDAPYRAARLLEGLKAQFPLLSFNPLFPLIARLRMVKEPDELTLIREACSITRNAFLQVLSTISPGISEYAVEAEITRVFISRGANGHAYEPIIASGKSACTLHYTDNNRLCADGSLLLLDIGAEYAHYAADLTRTIPVNGRFTSRQRQLYDATLRVFTCARNLFRPGTTINEINRLTGEKWQEEHLRLGLYTESDLKQHTGDEPLGKPYFIHGTSHFMGLDVHDTGSRDDVLMPGMVLTCEPAIYLPEEEVGIRLENDLLITENGCTDLMADIPIDPTEIEELMAGR